jgi:hypothetical protein
MPKCPPDLVPDFVYKATGEFFKMKGDKSSLAGRVNDLVLLPKAGTKAEVHKLTVDRLKDSGGGNYKQEDGTTRTMVKNPPSDWSAPAYLNLPDNNSYKLKYILVIKVTKIATGEVFWYEVMPHSITGPCTIVFP